MRGTLGGDPIRGGYTMRDIDRINKLRTEIERQKITIYKINQRLYKLECPHITKDREIISAGLEGFWQESCGRCGKIFELMSEDDMLRSKGAKLKAELDEVIKKIKQSKEDKP